MLTLGAAVPDRWMAAEASDGLDVFSHMRGFSFERQAEVASRCGIWRLELNAGMRSFQETARPRESRLGASVERESGDGRITR